MLLTGWSTSISFFLGGMSSAAFYGAGKAVSAVRDSVRSAGKWESKTELFLQDEFYNKNLPSQVTPGTKYLPQYDEFGNIKQIKMYDDYGREDGLTIQIMDMEIWVARIIIQFRTGMKGYIMHKIEMG